MHPPPLTALLGGPGRVRGGLPAIEAVGLPGRAAEAVGLSGRGSEAGVPPGRGAGAGAAPGRGAAAVIAAATTALVLALSVSAFAPGPRTSAPAFIALYQDGIAVDAAGELVALPAGAAAEYLPGSRVVDPAAVQRAVADRAWLAAGRVPGASGPYGEMVAGALLDLRALTSAEGALVAGVAPRWRYVWPRDASFGAAAMAVAGHPEDARRILLHLQELYVASARFEARYLPDGSGGVPDDRSPQSDGAGWVLWATSVYLDHVSPASRAARARELATLVDEARRFIRRETATRTGLPVASGDYWESPGRVVTLGTAAPLLAGLEAAAEIYPRLGRPAAARAARRDAARLRQATIEGFAAAGYPRRLGGELPDAATAFALPPFQPRALDGAQEAWQASIVPMGRPAGGLAPGAGWRDDGISWTPTTALYALAAASAGEREVAERLLTWLADHRTSSGALPEKVLADGSPAAVAPLAWTCALVVLAVDALPDDGAHPPGDALDALVAPPVDRPGRAL